MIPIHGLFEAHLTVSHLERSMVFYGETLGLKLAGAFPDRRAAFYWMGDPGQSMLGIWETGASPQHISLHIAFKVELSDLLDAPKRLRAANIVPRDFAGHPTDEPVVLAWMPAASLYFHDPDGHMLEYLCMLPDPPRPELGVIGWSEWNQARSAERAQ
jgi:catechol 2,3-dioxygenase-like lactoylglutathione lyase family enzyme